MHLISFFVFLFFLMWPLLKVCIEFVTILLLFYVLVLWPRGMWYLSSPTRDQTHTPRVGRQSLSHWTTGDVCSLFISSKKQLDFFSYVG